jgi:hypothetical protein
LDFREAITLIRHATIIIPTGTIGDRTTLIPSHIHITVATDTPRTTGVELTTAIIAIVITTAIELIVGDLGSHGNADVLNDIYSIGSTLNHNFQGSGKDDACKIITVAAGGV